jgi:hypothetical protein
MRSIAFPLVVNPECIVFEISKNALNLSKMRNLL